MRNFLKIRKKFKKVKNFQFSQNNCTVPNMLIFFVYTLPTHFTIKIVFLQFLLYFYNCDCNFIIIILISRF